MPLFKSLCIIIYLNVADGMAAKWDKKINYFLNSDITKPKIVRIIPIINNSETGSFSITEDKITVTTGIKYI